MKYRNLSFRPIRTNIGNTEGKGSTFAITNANANTATITIGNTEGKGSTFAIANANANTATNANAIGNTATNTITIANSLAIGNGDGTPRRECLEAYSSNRRTASSKSLWKP